MNKRSFRRGMQPPPLKKGWRRENEQEFSRQYPTVEAALRDTFEKALQQAVTEMERQNTSGESAPFNSWAVLNGENGQEFRVTIEGMPPTAPDPSLN